MIRINTLFWVLGLAALLTGACQPLAWGANPSLPLDVMAEASPFRVDSTEPYGVFNGTQYVMITGRFFTTADGTPKEAPFEIVAPADPNRSNGRLLVEPFHFVMEAGIRDLFLTPELLFSRGFSHAAICWQAPLDAPFVVDHACMGIESESGMTIIADFAQALKRGNAAGMVGNVDKLYSIGVSNSAGPLHELLRDPLGQDLFDLSLLITADWPSSTGEPFAPLPANLPEPLLPAESAGRVLVLQSEADAVLFYSGLLRDDHAHSNYRAYEVAGGQHIQPAGDTGLDWLPVVRALFVAGDDWVTEDREPPASVAFEAAPAGALDPVYDRPTGLVRDENLNAVGGIRLPDLKLGSRQYIAADLSGDTPLIGTVVELTCGPSSEGKAPFPDHSTYVSRFVQEAANLVEMRFLLPDDAYHLIVQAENSGVGSPDSCP